MPTHLNRTWSPSVGVVKGPFEDRPPGRPSSRSDRAELPGQIHCHPIQIDDRVWRQVERRGRTTGRAKGVPTMVELVYTRVSTDEQSTQRQTHLLAEAGLVDGTEGVRLFADPATSSKIPALERAGFRELARYARPGDRLTVSELYRLCRDLADILAAREWCRAHGVKLRVLSGPLSSIVDLAATTTMLVNVLVSVGQFQRDLQNELTRDGLAAVRAQGVRSGRRPQIARLGAVDQVRDAFRTGTSISALARKHQVSRVAIRTAVADLLPGRPEQPVPTSAGEPAASPDRDARQDRPPSPPGRGSRRARTASAAGRPTGAPRPGLQPARHRHTPDPPGTPARRRRAGQRGFLPGRPQGVPDLPRPGGQRVAVRTFDSCCGERSMQPVQRGGTGGGHDGQGAAGGTDRALDLVREPVLTACMSAFSVPAMSPARGGPRRR